MERLSSFEGSRESRKIISRSPTETMDLGRRIGELLPEGTVVSLEGGLGSGKTLLVKGMAPGLGIESDVLSPSFILMEEYKGERPVLHYDLYRLEELGEVERIGLFESVDGRNIVIVEWGDRLPEGALDFDVRIILKVTGDEEREIVIEAPADLLGAVTQDGGL
jgi:tRNA threonylcarbamoyladenosine biosynthesis protein TsaE